MHSNSLLRDLAPPEAGHTSGGRGVASSNLVIPTFKSLLFVEIFFGLVFYLQWINNVFNA